MTNVSATADGGTYRNDYTYEDDRLKTVRHNTSADPADDVVYTFEYDELGAQTQVKVGNQTLSTNVYDTDRSHKLLRSEFANGGLVSNTYDEFDRIEGVRFDGDTQDRYKYEYGANGQVAQVKDNLLNRTHFTEYDLALKPKRSTTKDNLSGNILYRATLKYDKYNHLTGFGELVKGRDAVGDDDGTEAFLTTYEYDKDDRTTEVQYEDEDHRVNYEYDAVGRVSKKIVKNGVNERTISYAYLAGGQGSGSTTPLVSKITQPGLILEYVYDDVGNITKEKRTDTSVTPNVVKEITYEYNKLGQLLRVDDQFDTTAGANGTTWQYVYDLGGNILSKTYHAYNNTTEAPGAAIETIPYAYGDANWKDKLTIYDNEPITYDAIGNPLSYDGWTYTWEKGRQLKQMASSEKIVEFAYDANGLRVQKKVIEGSTVTTTDYFLHGKLLMHLTRTVKVDGVQQGEPEQMHFFYDSQSRPQLVQFTNAEGEKATYSYLHNLQGDIIGIVDSTGTKVVEYGYDAWGKPTNDLSSLTTEYQVLAGLNPFRYRGYMWDGETRLYYLRTRHYNSEWLRFVNVDELMGTGGLLSHDLYTYCYNSPVQKCDPNGTLPKPATTPSPTSSLSKSTLAPSPSRPRDWDEQFKYRTYLESIRGPMKGPAGSHWRWLDGNGKWNERWMGEDGTPKLDRHWTNHGNDLKHPNVPHDEDWIPNGKGGKKLDREHPRPSPEGVEEPKEANWPLSEGNGENNASNILGGAVVVVGGYLVYQAVKWGVATILAPYTGGGSYVVVGAMG